MKSGLHPLPAQARRSRRVWLFWVMGGLALFVVVLAVIAFVYRKEIVAIGQVSLAIREGRAFAETKAPALRRDFPFDPASPPAFDADLFARYCRARRAIAERSRSIFEQMEKLGRTKPDSLKNPAAVLREIGPVFRDARGLFDDVEIALRDNRLSVELYRWVAAQTWGHVALAARRGDPDALGVMALLRAEFGPNFPDLARAPTPDRVAELLIEWLGEDFRTPNDNAAWDVIRAGWAAWSIGAPACGFDFAVVKYWDDFAREMRGLARKR